MTNLDGHSIILHSDWSVDPSRGSCIIRRRMLVDPTAVHTNPETLAGHFPSTPRLLSFPPPHQPIYLLAASSLPDLLAARRRERERESCLLPSRSPLAPPSGGAGRRPWPPSRPTPLTPPLPSPNQTARPWPHPRSISSGTRPPATTGLHRSNHPSMPAAALPPPVLLLELLCPTPPELHSIPLLLCVIPLA